MTVHFHREMDSIKGQILRLGALVEEQLFLAVKAVETVDDGLADTVISRDDRIDHLEVEIEEECLKVLALHQPVAIDLRLLISVLKINSDLERIGDMAVNIAETVHFLKENREEEHRSFDFHEMAELSRSLFRRSLDSLVNLDEALATDVCANDEQIDRLHRENYAKVESRIQEYPSKVGIYLRYLLISRNLERVGDHATNIAEDVLYMAKGRIVRHSIA